MSTLALYACTLGATAAAEAPIIAGVFARRDRHDALQVAILLNLVSHPTAAALILLGGVPWLLAELAVVVLEAAGLRAMLGWSAGRSWGCSLVANALTAAIALALG